MPWLAITSATLSLAVSAYAQQSDTAPARPANWPEFPPLSTPSGLPPIQTGTINTAANVPAFSGFGQGSVGPMAVSPPAATQNPTAALVPAQGYGSDNGSVRIWNVSGQDGSPAPQGQPSLERSPSQFGSGWRNFINQTMLNRDQPAATLAPPVNASAGPRPEWSWHGYDNYNQGRSNEIDHDVQANSAANADDMAPFMKYAHLWRP